MGSHHSVLLEAYSKIGEPDALQGAAVVCSEDASARLKIYEEEGQWTRALGWFMMIKCRVQIEVSIFVGSYDRSFMRGRG